MLFTSSQLLMLTFTLLSFSSLHSCWCALLSWQTGLHTGKEHLVQGNMGVLMGARQEGQTEEVIIAGPERTELSTRIVSLALIGLVAISPLPLPCHHHYHRYHLLHHHHHPYLHLPHLQGETLCAWPVHCLVFITAVVGRVAPGTLRVEEINSVYHIIR